MLSLNPESKRLLSTFLSYRNDIDIYTEDEFKDKEFYRFLFSKLVTGIKINDVTPLGCKDNVLARCRNEPPNGRKKLFIVDGDVDFIKGVESEKLPNLFTLDSYCIENFLFDETAIVNFLYFQSGIKPREQINIELDYQNWLGAYAPFFIELFIHFALCNHYQIPYKLGNAERYHDIERGDTIFNSERLMGDIGVLKRDILNLVSEEDYNIKYEEYSRRCPYQLSIILKVVSGKDYLLPLLKFKARKFKKSRAIPTAEELKMTLLQYSDLSRLYKLRDVIRNLSL